jgi:hypothetical protein
MVNSPNVVNKHQNTFIREMPFQEAPLEKDRWQKVPDMLRNGRSG